MRHFFSFIPLAIRESAVSELSKGGGYILGPAKEIQPETPDENIAAVVEAFIEQSK